MRRSINVLCLSATALVLLPTGVVAQQKSLKEQIQGPWSLASCNSTNARGEKAAYCANNPNGIMILAGNGNFAWTTIAGGRKDANAPGAAAIFGTWSVNEADKTLTKRSSLKGLLRTPIAPAFSARARVLSSREAVIKMIGVRLPPAIN